MGTAVPGGRRRVRRRIVVLARAKLNLMLAVGPRRPDGFHELLTVFQSVSLADTLTIEPRSRGFTLVVRHEDVALGAASPAASVERVPSGRGNLVLRAARLLEERAGLPGGARFELVKRIPSRAGLGGGSADAAAALVGLARLYGLGVGRRRLLEWGAALGSDVPFAIHGGTALGRGRGEHLTPLARVPRFRALVAVPRWRVSTAAAFRRIDRGKYGLTGGRAILRFGQRLGRDALRAQSIARFGNTFESVLGSRRLSFRSLCRRLRSAGLLEPRLTGSGSATYGILEPGTSAQSVVGSFSGNERLFVVRSVRSGVQVATAA